MLEQSLIEAQDLENMQHIVVRTIASLKRSRSQVPIETLTSFPSFSPQVPTQPSTISNEGNKIEIDVPAWELIEGLGNGTQIRVIELDVTREWIQILRCLKNGSFLNLPPSSCRKVLLSVLQNRDYMQKAAAWINTLNPL